MDLQPACAQSHNCAAGARRAVVSCAAGLLGVDFFSMTSSPQNDSPDPRQRIEELEAHVLELRTLVEDLLARGGRPGERRHDDEAAGEPLEPERPRLVDGFREGVAKALGGEAGEPLESRVGGIWLSRIAAVIAMTAIVLGGSSAFNDHALSAIQKVAIGYGLAAAAVAYGLISKKTKDLFPQTMLGSGLAILYFTTYAAFFFDSTRVFRGEVFAIPVLAACLVLVAAVCHFRRSETSAGISLFLIYYTVALSLEGGLDTEDVYYAMATCLVVSVLALVFHLTHRWLFFTWGALVATHVTYIYFFLSPPQGLELSGVEYFWVSNGFLTLSYALFSVACITDARKTGEYRTTVAPMAAVNSFVYFVLTWLAIREQYSDQEWAFRLCFAAALGVFAFYAQSSRAPRNYLYQVFAAKTVVMFTLALQAYLSHEWLLVAMAIECLGLGFSYKRSGTVIFKALGLGLLLLTFAGCVGMVRVAGEVALFGHVIPAKWFTGVGVSAVFALVAWYYDRFVKRLSARQRTEKVQRILADSALDLRSTTMAMLHAAAAALILLVLTILDQGSSPDLPFLLAGESVLMAVAGFLLRTAQVEVASVLLLIAAHVCYHLFLVLDGTVFEAQEAYRTYTAMVAVFTYFGGYLWERYLRRFNHGRPWEHHALASVPYLAGTMMLATLMARSLERVQVPAGMALLGLCLTLAAALTLLPALRSSGALALGIGAWYLYRGVYTFAAPLPAEPGYGAMLTVLLLGFAGSERVLAIGPDRETNPVAALRSCIVGVAALLGVAGLWEWAPDTGLTFYLLGLAMASMGIGVAFGERRYRWTALAVYFAAIGRAYSHDLNHLAPSMQFVSFAALCVPLLVISWGYSRYRVRTLRRLKGNEDDGRIPRG